MFARVITRKRNDDLMTKVWFKDIYKRKARQVVLLHMGKATNGLVD